MGEILNLVVINRIIFDASWSSIFCFDLSMTALYCPNTLTAQCTPLSSSMTSLRGAPHSSLYFLYQLADLTHCSLPCHVFCRWTTGVPTNFLNSEKTKIMNNFELKPGKYIPAHLLQTSLAAKLQNHEALCALETCLFFFSGWNWNQHYNLKKRSFLLH